MSKLCWISCAAVAANVWSPVANADDTEPPAIEVEVEGPRRLPDRGPKDPTVAASVISRDELAAPGLRVAELLRAQVGVQVSESGGQGAPATASVRGATAAQLPVYLAGVSLNDDVTGAADLSRIPLWLIDRVEIYRGNAPLEADRLGLGGAIFFEPRWPKSTEAGAGAKVGSYGTRGAWGYASVGNRDAAWLAGVSADAATNDYPFVDDHGTLLAPTGSNVVRLTNADVTTYDGWLLGRARLAGNTVVEALGNATARSQGVPTLALVPSRAARATFDRGVGAVRAIVPVLAHDAGSLEVRTAVSAEHVVYDDPLRELALLTQRLALSGARVDQRVALRVPASDALTVHGAVDVSSETLIRDLDDTDGLRAHRQSSRVAVGARQRIGDAFSIQPIIALQCDGTSTTTTAVCSAFEPSGRIGLAWTQSTWDVFANFGRYVRPPTIGELYGVSVVVHGNPALRAESGLIADVGLRWGAAAHGTRPAPWSSLDAYVRSASDLVSFVRSSQGFVEPLNVSSARVAGLEAQAGTGLWHWFSADVTATFLDARNTTADRLTTNDILPFLSRLVFVPRMSAEWRPREAPWVGLLRAELLWTYQSSRFADAAGLAVIPAQSSLDAELLARTADETLAVRLRAVDLLDDTRFDVVGFPLPGRSFFLSLEAKR